MAIDLEGGVQLASSKPCNVQATISVHEDSNVVLYGLAAPTYRADVPLRSGTTTLAGGTVTTAGSGFRSLTRPGFSTRGNPPPGPNLQMDQFLSSSRIRNVPPVKIQRFVEDQPVPLEFSVRLQPPLLTWLSYLGIGSTIQLQLAILDAPAGNVMSFVTLDAEPDGVLLRAVGPGLVTANTRAAYTVTLDVAPIIP